MRSTEIPHVGPCIARQRNYALFAWQMCFILTALSCSILSREFCQLKSQQTQMLISGSAVVQPTAGY